MIPFTKAAKNWPCGHQEEGHKVDQHDHREGNHPHKLLS